MSNADVDFYLVHFPEHNDLRFTICGLSTPHRCSSVLDKVTCEKCQGELTSRLIRSGTFRKEITMNFVQIVHRAKPIETKCGLPVQGILHIAEQPDLITCADCKAEEMFSAPGRDQMKHFTREELNRLEERCTRLSGHVVNLHWRRAYQDLEHALNVLDSYIARSTAQEGSRDV